MSFFTRIKQTAIDIGGPIIGFLEMAGLHYSVVPYMAKVSDLLYRGSRPDRKKLLELEEMGCHSIINLCAEMNHDAPYACLTKIPIIYIPIIDNMSPTIGQMVEFCNFTLDPTFQPVYVHCEAGRGRTGVAVACYRIAVEGWSFDSAIAEARTMGLESTFQANFIQEFAEQVQAGKIELIVH